MDLRGLRLRRDGKKPLSSVTRCLDNMRSSWNRGCNGLRIRFFSSRATTAEVEQQFRDFLEIAGSGEQQWLDIAQPWLERRAGM